MTDPEIDAIIEKAGVIPSVDGTTTYDDLCAVARAAIEHGERKAEKPWLPALRSNIRTALAREALDRIGPARDANDAVEVQEHMLEVEGWLREIAKENQ